MNFLDAHAIPIDIFTDKANLTPFQAQFPNVALDNSYPPEKPSEAMLKYMKLTEKQNLTHADMANPRELNEIIWFSVRGNSTPIPEIARLPAFDIMTAGIKPDDDDDEKEVTDDDDD